MSARLLQCLACAVVKHGGRFLFSLAPGGEVIYDIAVEAWTTYSTNDKADSVRPELEALAQASADQVRQLVADAVKEAAAGKSPQVQEALRAYLTQVPTSVRRSMRRPSDPSGKSVPADLALRGAEDLVTFLPARMPRFKPGDHPLPGVDWELEELAGVGGFGEVWKARHAFLKSKAPVALKFCLDSSAAAALRNEAGVLDRVMQEGKHAGIVPLLHTYLTANPPCLEYEYVEGGDLTGLIQEMHARGQVKPEVANRLLLQLAEIVAFAHQAEPPIVHGDLKPANVLARRSAEGKIALRVIDFGIGGIAAARAAQEVRKPSRSRPQLLTEAVRGAHTPLYASPEQMARRPGALADPRDDVHALGVIWFQLITGDLAMTSIPPDWREQLAERGVGEDLIRLVGACVAPKADKRPASAVVLVEQIIAANVPMLELADADAAGTAKSEKPRAAAPTTARPETARGAPPVGQRALTKPQPQAATAWSAAAKLSKNQVRLAGAGGAVLLVGVLGLCTCGWFLGNRPQVQSEWQVSQPPSNPVDLKAEAKEPKAEAKEPKDEAKEPKDEAKEPKDETKRPKDDDDGQKVKVSKNNFDKLKVGMTQKQVEDILGLGKLAATEDVDAAIGSPWSDLSSKARYRKHWSEAAKENLVCVWKGERDTIVLASFSRNPSSAGKAEAFCYNTRDSSTNRFLDIGTRFKVTPENFAKLTVGMTLGQLQEILGKGQRAAAEDVKEAFREGQGSRGDAWTKAVKEDRVQVWQDGGDFNYNLRILAVFPDAPSAGSKVEFLLSAVNSFSAGRFHSQIAQRPDDKWTLNVSALKLGMTLKELDEILGVGRLAVKGDIDKALVAASGVGVSRTAAWTKAAKEERVQVWQGGGGYPIILAAFPGVPTAGNKVEVLYHRNITDKVQKPADKWAVTKDNFDKVKVGMTLKELDEILGVGHRMNREQAVHVYWGRTGKLEEDELARKASWEKAIKEQRVQLWSAGFYGAVILAAFSEPTSDDTKVQAFYYYTKDIGYEHKGSVSSTTKEAQPKSP